MNYIVTFILIIYWSCQIINENKPTTLQGDYNDKERNIKVKLWLSLIWKVASFNITSNIAILIIIYPLLTK